MIDLAHDPFFIFGCGSRPKFLCTAQGLKAVATDQVVAEFKSGSLVVSAAEYSVAAQDAQGNPVHIAEDEDGIWLTRNGQRECLADNPVSLPSFDEHRYRDRLRVLHNEILTNIHDGRPLPNLFVYRKPWFRDAAMMAMVLEITGNVGSLRDWILNIRDPFDRNNAGHEEPDNLGQVLYLVSLVSDAAHPVVSVVLEAAQRFTTNGYLCGITDGREHPVYQTKWLKFGLSRLGLADDYTVPQVEDGYAPLFWWDRDNIPEFSAVRHHEQAENYPYLTWAEAHFYGDPLPLRFSANGYPLTWEARASEADYEGMRAVDAGFVSKKLGMPHAWHAAEMFLTLYEEVSQ